MHIGHRRREVLVEHRTEAHAVVLSNERERLADPRLRGASLFLLVDATIGSAAKTAGHDDQHETL
ncbi:MAG: hypothetical protein ACRBN8_25685 [Nannocystales bacterium]